jgi:uncharacterized protein (DUF2141 family)
MARIIVLFSIALALLASCAQVGQLTGGEKDTYAPVPTKTTPENGTLLFTGNEISISFDEFIQLNNPQQSLLLMPNHAKPKATVQNKTLHISWNEQLQANTTYVLYMDGLVKDTREGNDSLMKYVFSTGAAIDSISYSVQLKDAFTNQAKSNCVVGLYSHPDSLQPIYFSKTNNQGLANFSYLKEGIYYLKAFEDVNKDLVIQETEAQGFKTEALELFASFNDTIPVLLSQPLPLPKMKGFKFVGPGSFIVTANHDLSNKTFQLDQTLLKSNQLTFLSKDSVQLFYTVKDEASVKLIVSDDLFSDTLETRITERERKSPLRLNPVYKNNQVSPRETVVFKSTALLSTVDSTKIKVMNLQDSMPIPFHASIHKNEVQFDFDRTKLKDVEVTFEKGAFKNLAGLESDIFKSSIQLKVEKDYGIIHVNAATFSEKCIIELLQNGKVIAQTLLPETKKLDFDYLLPGEYQFRVIEDVNQNFQWDPVNPILKEQAEKVYFFTTNSKVRANWEIDVVLSPN